MRKLLTAVLIAVSVTGTASAFSFSSHRRPDDYYRYRYMPKVTATTTAKTKTVTARTKKSSADDLSSISTPSINISKSLSTTDEEGGKLIKSTYVPQIPNQTFTPKRMRGSKYFYGAYAYISYPAMGIKWYPVLSMTPVGISKHTAGKKLHVSPTKVFSYKNLKITFRQLRRDRSVVLTYRDQDGPCSKSLSSIPAASIMVNGYEIGKCILKRPLSKDDSYRTWKGHKRHRCYYSLQLSCSSYDGKLIPDLSNPSIAYLYMNPSFGSAYLLQTVIK